MIHLEERTATVMEDTAELPDPGRIDGVGLRCIGFICIKQTIRATVVPTIGIARLPHNTAICSNVTPDITCQMPVCSHNQTPSEYSSHSRIQQPCRVPGFNQPLARNAGHALVEYAVLGSLIGQMMRHNSQCGHVRKAHLHTRTTTFCQRTGKSGSKTATLTRPATITNHKGNVCVEAQRLSSPLQPRRSSTLEYLV